MTFSIDTFARAKSGANERSQGAWLYKSTDAIATIIASGYFNAVGITTTKLQVGDIIWVEASDAHRMLRVTSVTTNVTVETYDTYEGSLDLAEGSIFLGDSSGKATSLSAKTDTQILVGNGTTLASVAMSGDATLANTGAITIATDAITTTKILDSNVTEAKIAPNTLTGTVAANVADANVIGGIPQLFRIDTAGGATANTDVTVTHKIRVIDVWVVNRGTGTASDTITITDGTNAITDAIDISGADKTVARVGTIDDAYHEIAAAGTLRVTETDGGGSDSPATTVYVSAIRVA